MSYSYSYNDEPIMTIDEQQVIVEWVKKNYKYFKSTGFNRYFQQLDYFDDVPLCVWEIKKRIVENEKLHNYQQEPIFKDSVGYMSEGGELHLHTDPNPNNSELYHTRFNVYVQIPDKGGLPIYNNKICNLQERTYICCRSGIDKHCCQKVEGKRERIVISFGFLLPFERIQNIIYNYNYDSNLLLLKKL